MEQRGELGSRGHGSAARYLLAGAPRASCAKPIAVSHMPAIARTPISSAAATDGAASTLCRSSGQSAPCGSMHAGLSKWGTDRVDRRTTAAPSRARGRRQRWRSTPPRRAARPCGRAGRGRGGPPSRSRTPLRRPRRPPDRTGPAPRTTNSGLETNALLSAVSSARKRIQNGAAATGQARGPTAQRCQQAWRRTPERAREAASIPFARSYVRAAARVDASPLDALPRS